MQVFLLCFIPLFVAIDPLGLVPIFVHVTQGYTPAQRRRLVLEAVPTAAAIAVSFFLLGRLLLKFLNIGVDDLRIAGGALLFLYALLDLFLPGKPSVEERESAGIVPLATPLIAGPAVLTLGPVLVDKYGGVAAVGALLLNLLLLGLVFFSVDALLRVIPLNAMQAVSKVVDLLLAAIGVSLVREGVLSIIAARAG